MSSKSLMANPSDREIVSTRTFAAPRERVFEAFSDPTQLARWWGPKGFTNTIHEFDLRPGGMWRLVMHAPNGADYANESRFASQNLRYSSIHAAASCIALAFSFKL